MLTVAEAAQRVGRSEETLRRWVRSGRLRARRDGGRIRIDAAVLDALVAPRGLELPAPWRETALGTEQPDWVALVGRSRGARR